MKNQILIGDALEGLRQLPDGCVHCVVTSPPYWGLRDYGAPGQLGLEENLDCLGWATGARCGECYICRMVEVFGEVRRVMRDDATCWVNMGDSYATGISKPSKPSDATDVGYWSNADSLGRPRIDGRQSGLKAKDLTGQPWRLALALQKAGWWLRQDIIWHKPNPMPESITDRCTKSHEYLFLLSKSERYYYDAVAVMDLAVGAIAGNKTHKQEAAYREKAISGTERRRVCWMRLAGHMPIATAVQSGRSLPNHTAAPTSRHFRRRSCCRASSPGRRSTACANPAGRRGGG